MVKRAKTQFIVVTMTILFFVFAIILGATSYSRTSYCREAAKDRLSRIEKNYEKGEILNEGLIIVATNENEYSVKDGSSLFTDEQTAEIVSSAFALHSEVSAGSIGTIYFQTYNVSDGSYLVVAADMSDLFSAANSHTLQTLIFLLVFYVVLALPVWGLAHKVFQPIQDSLYNQRKFIADASHELKTPVAVISANADVLSAQTSNKYLDSIKTQTKRLNFLVNDMLTLARMDEKNQPLLKENFSLSDVITETVLPFDAVAFEHGKMLLSEIEKNVAYYGDRESVKKIINILLDNAVKYASNGGTIKVTLSKTTLTVGNSGSDILDSDSNRVFERFYRGELSRSRETGGSGLGLSIAKSIADANKWTISAKSRYGESMTITVNF